MTVLVPQGLMTEGKALLICEQNHYPMVTELKLLLRVHVRIQNKHKIQFLFSVSNLHLLTKILNALFNLALSLK